MRSDESAAKQKMNGPKRVSNDASTRNTITLPSGTINNAAPTPSTTLKPFKNVLKPIRPDKEHHVQDPIIGEQHAGTPATYNDLSDKMKEYIDGIVAHQMKEAQVQQVYVTTRGQMEDNIGVGRATRSRTSSDPEHVHFHMEDTSYRARRSHTPTNMFSRGVQLAGKVSSAGKRILTTVAKRVSSPAQETATPLPTEVYTGDGRHLSPKSDETELSAINRMMALDPSDTGGDALTFRETVPTAEGQTTMSGLARPQAATGAHEQDQTYLGADHEDATTQKWSTMPTR